MTTRNAYKEAFPLGTEVSIADRAFLENFLNTWKYHHKLQPDQLDFAHTFTMVSGVSFYHGGGPLYALVGTPGLWHEQCLRPKGAETGI